MFEFISLPPQLFCCSCNFHNVIYLQVNPYCVLNFQTINKQRKFMLILSALGLICMFLPWVKISFLGMGASTNGMHGIGILVFICFLVYVKIHSFLEMRTSRKFKTVSYFFT